MTSGSQNNILQNVKISTYYCMFDIVIRHMLPVSFKGKQMPLKYEGNTLLVEVLFNVLHNYNNN